MPLELEVMALLLWTPSEPEYAAYWASLEKVPAS
jgi:hypothetical protein